MIKLFVSDIDGCLAEPYQPFDQPRFQEIARYARAAIEDGLWPAFSLCSGRSYPYVEAMTQALGLQMPVLFESGGGLFDPVEAKVQWHPGLTSEVEIALEKVRRWMLHECLPGSSLMFDFSKRTQVGMAGPNTHEVAVRVPLVEQFVAAHTIGLRVFHTPISIDVLAAGITKRQGIFWLGEATGCPLEQMAFIGDTVGDLEALETVGYSFAPANATEAVKQVARQVTQGAVIEGVLEAYQWCVARNRQSLKKAS